ncbi:MAG: DUF4381 domain-containing protein [Arenicellales bacterium]
MNPTANPLDALRDIHLPADPSWWPPAPGWWILGLLLIAGVLFLIRVITARRRLTLPSRELVTQLERVNLSTDPEKARDALIRMSRLVRRFAVTRYGRPNVARLTGDEWLGFLDQVSQSKDFTLGPGKLLAEGPYRSQSTDELNELKQTLINWAKKSPTKHRIH